jgi:hypothetical protein
VCDGVDNDCDGKTDGQDLCDDGDPCTQGICALSNGKVQCLQQPGASGSACDDGDPCTPSSTCQMGGCLGSIDCDDGVACTSDACGGSAGCSHTPNPLLCKDGNSCTSDTCDAKAGCSNPAAEGSCDDGDACTTGSLCAAGVCQGNQPLVCDDSNPCTTDSCDKLKGCAHVANSAACDDGNPCNIGELCSATKCQGGKGKCDDGNLCTADSCDAQGACTNAAINACKPCAAAGDCNDADACTTDACTAGKCVNSKISGCVGPTDYSVASWASNKPVLAPGAVANFTVGVSNLGKPYSGAAAGKLQWEVWFSADDKIDAGDVKVASKAWAAYNIGAPNQTSASDTQAWQYAKPAAWFHKFQCVRLVFAADANPADNEKCIAVTVEDGEAGLTSVGPGGKIRVRFDGNALASTVELQTDNPGPKAVKPVTTVWLSADDKWDATDKPLSNNLSPTVLPGKTATTLSFSAFAIQSAIGGKVWVCVRMDPDTAVYEKVPGDNSLCGQVDLENPAELLHGDPTYTNGYLTFDQGGSGWGVNWGATAACKKLGVYNVGLGAISGGFKSRCFLSTTGLAANAGWMVEWQHGGNVASGQANCQGYTCGSKVDLLSPVGPAIKPPAVGASKLCVEVNYDKALLEVDYSNNLLCVPVTVTGPNIQISTKLTAENKGQPVVLKIGTAWSDMFAVYNAGNADLAGVEGKFMGRIYLSKDAALSADDVKLWEGVQSGLPTFTKQVGTLPNYYALPTPTTKPAITVPAGTATGAAYLLYVINPDNAFAEPAEDNLFAKPVSVVP